MYTMWPRNKCTYSFPSRKHQLFLQIKFRPKNAILWSGSPKNEALEVVQTRTDLDMFKTPKPSNHLHCESQTESGPRKRTWRRNSIELRIMDLWPLWKKLLQLFLFLQKLKEQSNFSGHDERLEERNPTMAVEFIFRWSK
jgi:hypothetical protein